MKKITNFEMLLGQEVTNLERFIVKEPLGTNAFWSEWQTKIGEIVVTKAAIKKSLRLHKEKLTDEEITKLATLMEAYKEIAEYLELLRQTALKVRGVEVQGWDIFDETGDSEGEDDFPF